MFDSKGLTTPDLGTGPLEETASNRCRNRHIPFSLGSSPYCAQTKTYGIGHPDLSSATDCSSSDSSSSYTPAHYKYIFLRQHDPTGWSSSHGAQSHSRALQSPIFKGLVANSPLKHLSFTYNLSHTRRLLSLCGNSCPRHIAQ